MKKIILLAFIVCAFSAKAQYKTAFGIRLGEPFGLTLKHFVSEDNALEGILSFRSNGFEFIGLYEHHIPANFGVPGFNWFVGFGGHFGLHETRSKHRYDDADVILGVDGIAGLEYKIPSAPFCFALDLKPAINFVPGPFLYLDGGFSLRYCF